MPVNLPGDLPAVEALREENIFVMTEDRAIHQDIRPLKMLIVNLMPLKRRTETQLLRLLSNTPLQIELDLLRTQSYEPQTTPQKHLEAFYKTFDDVKKHKYDGMIITGAPVEHLEFEEVKYWEEMQEIMDWSTKNVTSSLFICWAAQAGLNHFYDIDKYELEGKLFGVFEHSINYTKTPLIRGFNDYFYAPHSRWTGLRSEDIKDNSDLKLLSESEKAGPYIILDDEKDRIFVTGHSEYDPNTLKREYFRDKEKGIDIDIPENYFPEDDPSREPIVRWNSHANLLFSNWLNYYVYQVTPFLLEGNEDVIYYSNK